jgi:hypothetical protein
MRGVFGIEHGLGLPRFAYADVDMGLAQFIVLCGNSQG